MEEAEEIKASETERKKKKKLSSRCQPNVGEAGPRCRAVDSAAEAQQSPGQIQPGDLEGVVGYWQRFSTFRSIFPATRVRKCLSDTLRFVPVVSSAAAAARI